METLFLQILDMSATASFIIPFVLITRFFLQKSPKIFSYALWSVVFFQLLFPFSLESPVGLLPSQAEPTSHLIFPDSRDSREETNKFDLISPKYASGTMEIDEDNSTQGEITPDSLSKKKTLSTLDIAVSIWGLGVLSMVGYAVFSYLKLKKILAESIPDKKNGENVYLCDYIKSPFVLGMANIYLPSSMNEEEKPLILAHEKHHIKRFDHITRPLSFLALCLHWFNPLVWVAYKLSGKDMELSCDEAVLKDKPIEIRGEYVYSLLKFASPKEEMIPLAFSEKDLKGRVKNIMKIKNTKLWVYGLSSALVLGLAVGFALEQPETVVEIKQAVIEEDNSMNEELMPYWSNEEIKEAWANAEEFGGTSIYYSDRYVPITFITESISLSELLEETVSVSIQVSSFHPDPNVWTPYSVYFKKDEALFDEVFSILSKYNLSPINYFLYAGGGGDYFESNKFLPSSEFQYSCNWHYLDEGEKDEFRKTEYKTMCFHWGLEDGTKLQLDLYENYNAVLSHYKFDEVNECLIYSYQLPYCLKGSDVALFEEISDFMEEFNTPSNAVPIPQELSVEETVDS